MTQYTESWWRRHGGQESIRLQQAGLRRVRWILMAAAVVLVFAIVAMVALLARVSETLR